MITTLNQIRRHGPCRDGWEKLLRHLNKTAADDEPLPIATVLASNGLADALWCLRAVEGRDREIRLYAVWCARQVQRLMRDPRSIAALDAAERFARGRANGDDLEAARVAAWAAARVAAAVWAAAAAALAAAAAAWWAAAETAWAAAEAEARAAGASSRDAMKAAQAAELRRICQEIEAREISGHR